MSPGICLWGNLDIVRLLYVCRSTKFFSANQWQPQSLDLSVGVKVLISQLPVKSTLFG